MQWDINHGYNVYSCNDHAEDWYTWPFFSLESAMESFYNRIEVEYDFVSVVQINDGKILAYHSKKAFDKFKIDIETELRE